MRPIFALAALAACIPAAVPAATCGGHGTPQTTFVTTQWLADHLEDKNLVILAVGTDQKEFEEAHIPGSLFFDYHDSHEMKSAAGLNTELPSMDVLAKNFAKYGVSADTVRKVIKRVGNSRKKVYAALDKM